MVGSAVPWWQVIQLNIVIVPESCEVTVVLLIFDDLKGSKHRLHEVPKKVLWYYWQEVVCYDEMSV